MNILKVKREEKGVFLFAIVLTMVLNALTIYHYFGDFTTLHNNYFNLFIGSFASLDSTRSLITSSLIGKRDTMCIDTRSWLS